MLFVYVSYWFGHVNVMIIYNKSTSLAPIIIITATTNLTNEVKAIVCVVQISNLTVIDHTHTK